MSKYTTEVRFICETEANLPESKGYNAIDEILNNVHSKIFDFEYPIFDTNYKKALETKILKHYYTREIGEETVGLWKLRLNAKLNEIMPYYNKLYESELLQFNPLYTHNITREHIGEAKDVTSNSSNTTNTYNSTVSDNGSTQYGSNIIDNGSNESTEYQLYSDTPQGGLNGVDSETYLTNATKNTDNTSNSNTRTHSGSDTTFNTRNNTGSDRVDGTTNGIADNTNHYLETIVGYEGKDASEMIMKYRKTFLNIDMEVINELEVLFMQLW